MGKKGAKRHLKRKPAPKFWPISKKRFVWAIRPTPGPHSLENCLPLGMIIRDILGFAETRREAKKIISNEKVLVDGKVRLKDDYPVGLMDVIHIREVEKTYRVLPSAKGFILHPIEGEESSFKLCRVENKNIVKNGHIQLNLHDGSNILIKVADPANPVEDVYATLDVLKIKLPEREILGHIKMKKGVLAIITGGKNMGKFGKIVEIEERAGQKRRNWLVTIEDNAGNAFKTRLNYIFPIGENQPLISLPQGE
jgi:small subunit ribosomal protein S4e